MTTARVQKEAGKKFTRLGRFMVTFWSLFYVTIKQLTSYIKYRVHSFGAVECSIAYISQNVYIKRVIYVKLDEINQYLTKSKYTEEPLCGKNFFTDKFIMSGEWDLNVKPIMPNYYRQDHKRAITFRSTYQIFRDGIPYWKCDEYKKKLKGDCGYVQASEIELEQKYRELQGLFDSIKTDGYLSQKELKRKRKHWHDEIRVAIARDGRFLKIAESGNHRLAMAQILNIEYVPVFIQGVHYEWALKCCRKHGGHLLQSINKELRLYSKCSQDYKRDQ